MKLSVDNAGDAQGRFRDSIAEQARLLIEVQEIGFVEAIVACMGAAAILAGVLSPAVRTEIVEQIERQFAETVEQRAREIRSGEYDDGLSRGQQ